MRECTRCPHYADLCSGAHAWEDLPCAHCTSTYARTRSEAIQRRQVIPAPPRIDPPSVEDFIARKTVLAWTHVVRCYPAAASYILAKLGDQSLSYARIARRFKVSKSTVQYQIGLAVMAEPDLAGLLSVDHTRTRRHAHKKH